MKINLIVLYDVDDNLFHITGVMDDIVKMCDKVMAKHLKFFGSTIRMVLNTDALGWFCGENCGLSKKSSVTTRAMRMTLPNSAERLLIVQGNPAEVLNVIVGVAMYKPDNFVEYDGSTPYTFDGRSRWTL